MTDAERYQQILDKYTPPGVVFVPVEDTDDGHRGMAHVDEVDDDEGTSFRATKLKWTRREPTRGRSIAV